MHRMIALLLVLLLSACSAAQDPAAVLKLAQDTLQQGLSMELSITVPDGEARGELHCDAGEQSLCFLAPQTLEGLCFCRTAAALSISMEGLSESVQAGDLLESSVANCLFDALDALLAAEELSVGEDALWLDYGGGRLYLGWDGRMQRICCENTEIILE